MGRMSSFSWVAFYSEFADKLLTYIDDRKSLIETIKNVYADIGMRLPMLERDNNIVDIDPFTVFALFNKGISNSNRVILLKGLAKAFSISEPVPEVFDGIPVVNNLAATFYYFVGDRKDSDIDNLWQVYKTALEFSAAHTEASQKAFVEAYNKVLPQKGVKWNLTMGLFWIRPYEFINLDSRNRWFLRDAQNMPVDFVESLDDFDSVPDGEKYLSIIEACKKALQENDYDYKYFPELSYFAWKISEQVNEENRASNSKQSGIGDENVRTTHYWIYSPGDNACLWEDFYSADIMSIGWGEIGNLLDYDSKDAIKAKLKELYGQQYSHKNAALATWQFAKEMCPGDVIFVKKGRHKLIGRGVVTGKYEHKTYIGNNEYSHSRGVNWTHKGEWEHPGHAAMKTLTDITSYTEYIQQLNAIFVDELIEDVDEIETEYPVYSADDFLKEVFMNPTDYETLVGLVKNKQNVILQGAPGVGKTYAAKRLAYSIMGEKNQDRVMLVQFHQSYTYEDFIEGFRPTSAGNGFEIKKGSFYNFCKKAGEDLDNEYFFIIDEINRGNLSKIFGELFMLIENDKRGNSLQLLYSDEKFNVPKNVYIIGMMNTADRSLAMLDYALRRRFAFYTMNPGFNSKGFIDYKFELSNDKFNKLIGSVESLNSIIANDDSLGEGFCIGHSYFCNIEDVTDSVLSNIVEYELIPLLKEYWFDEPTKVKDWSNNLRSAIK